MRTVSKRKPDSPADEAQKKPRIVAIEVDEAEVSGPSLLGDVFVPFSKVLEGEASYPLSTFRPDVKIDINDWLTVDTALDFAYNSIPRRDRKMLKKLDSTSLHQRLALGIAQVMGLATEAIDRSEGASEKIEEMSAQRDADETEITTLTSLLKAEEKRSSEQKKEINLLQDDLNAVRSSNEELEAKNEELSARVAFLEGEGSSQLISNFLSSDEGRNLLVRLCTPARNLGYHKALVALGPRCPDMVITSEKGYNAKANEALNQAFAELKLVQVDGRQYVPPTPKP